MTESNDLSSPGEGRRLLGSQLASEAAANLLWRGAKGIAGDAWNLIKVPGQILERSLTPSMEPGPNQLSIPEYALGLAGMGLGTGNVLGGAGAGAARQFGAWHGTGARPFQQFADEYMGSGEGAQAFGWGHYVAGARKTGELYRRKISGGGLVPLDEKGFPLSDEETFNKFYEPGTIVPSYGGRFDRVINNAKDPYGGYQTRVQAVAPNVDLLDNPEALSESARAALEHAGQTGQVLPEGLLSDPGLWRDIEWAKPRVHSIFPSSRGIEAVGKARGWNLGEPGGLLHINVVPEEHELLDLDLPFKQQEPGVQDKLNGLYRKLYGLEGDPRKVEVNPERTGRQVQQDIAHIVDRSDSSYVQDMVEDLGRRRRLTDGTPEEVASKLLDDVGIPGNKFLDAASRGKTPQPILKHIDDFQTAPNPQMAEQYVKDYPAITYASGGSIDDEIRAVSSYLRNTPGAERGSDYHKLADWVDSEHAAGKFSIGDNRTRNFVVFDPKNLEIRTWNGIPLTPVEGNPFGTGEQGGTP